MPVVPSKTTPTPSHGREKRIATLNIDMIGRMWLGFQMQEILTTQQGKKKLKEKRTREDFIATGTPASKIQKFWSLWRAFPRTKQLFFPNEWPNVVPCQHLHFTQIPMYEKTSQDMALTEGFHVTI